MRTVPTWIQTHSGRKFFPLKPDHEEIVIEDIAHSLSQQCRFTGHCSWPYSVGQHSVLVSRQVNKMGGNIEDQLWGLLHDASEAYAVDVPTPVKRQIVGYAEIESRIMDAVAEKFSLKGAMPEVVKVADDIMLATEARDLMGLKDLSEWGIQVYPDQDRIKKMSASAAKREFLSLFHHLVQAR